MEPAVAQAISDMSRVIENQGTLISNLTAQVKKVNSRLRKEKYSKKEVCNILDICYATLQSMIEQGVIATTPYGKRDYITDEQLETYFESTRN